ncbi:MAG: 3-phosphoshikimate 1-carboxyvinyltransferase [Candidatus Aminicenantales bacterium]
MRVCLKRSRGYRSQVSVPGDKSISHRAAIICSLASGVSEISNFLHAEDCLATLKCLKGLGVEIRQDKDRSLMVKGMNLFGFSEPRSVLDARNSGTTARFLLGLLSGQNFFSVLSGDSSLRKRPMKRVVSPLRKMGAWIEGTKGGENLPLAIKGQKLKALSYKLPLPSAQLKSALILAALLAEGESEISEPIPSRDHTERMLLYMGAGLKKENGLIKIQGERSFQQQKIEIPGDFSSAAFFITAAVLVENSELILPDIGINPTRTGFLRILKKMGAKIAITRMKKKSHEPLATLTVSSSELKGTTVRREEIPSLIDEIPLIVLCAARAEGKTVIRGASELRVKESDRIRALVFNLRKMGVEVEEREDGLALEGPQPLKGALLHSFGDHRIAMAMAIAGLIAEGETEIEDFSCYRVSFPNFYRLLMEWQDD